MDSKKLSIRLQNRTEEILLSLFFFFALYMLIGSFSFNNQVTRTFPQATAITVIVGTVLLMVRNYLPEPLHTLVTDSVSLMDSDTVESEEIMEEIPNRPATGYLPIQNSIFTALSATGYVILGYLVGFLIASPIYVLFYTFFFDTNWMVNILLAIISILLVYVGISLLNLPLNEGVLLTIGQVVSKEGLIL